MKPGEVGILLAVAGIGLLMYSNQQESVFIGATKYQSAGQFTYRSDYPSQTGSKPTPASRSRSSGGGVGGPDTKAKYDRAYREQAQRNYWKRVSQIPPAIRRKLVQSWITRARKIAAARLAAIINAKRRSGYQTVGYGGGFGGTIAPTVPGVTGAVGANTYSAYEEALGLKPAGQSKTTTAAKAMAHTANGAIQDFINCKGNKACREAAVAKFDQIIMSKSTAVANSLYQLKGQFDPTQSQV